MQGDTSCPVIQSVYYHARAYNFQISLMYPFSSLIQYLYSCVFLLSDVVSIFSFKYPVNIESSDSGTNCGVMVDEDGDLIVCRKADNVQKEGIIMIGKVLWIDHICSE
jgi:hypothetical protein